MEITQENERFTIVDTNERGWTAKGTINTSINGHLIVTVTINSLLDDYIGDFSYTKSTDDYINVRYSGSEKNRDAIAAYADTIIDFILNNFKN